MNPDCDSEFNWIGEGDTPLVTDRIAVSGSTVGANTSTTEGDTPSLTSLIAAVIPWRFAAGMMSVAFAAVGGAVTVRIDDPAWIHEAEQGGVIISGSPPEAFFIAPLLFTVAIVCMTLAVPVGDQR